MSFQISFIDRVNQKQYKKCLASGIFLGLTIFAIPIIATLIDQTNSMSFIGYLGALTIYTIGSNNDMMKLKNIIKKEELANG